MVRVYLDEGNCCAALLKSVEENLAGAAPVADAVRAHLGTILAAFASGAPQHHTPVARREAVTDVVLERLSAREKDVLNFLVQGMPNKRIATTMNVSIDTVKWHLKNLFSKLGVADRLQAVDKARKCDLLNHS